MSLRETLLATADDWCRQKGMSKARLATLAVNDGKFFDRVGQGGDCTLQTYEKLMRYMANNPPAPAPAGQ